MRDCVVRNQNPILYFHSCSSGPWAFLAGPRCRWILNLDSSDFFSSAGWLWTGFPSLAISSIKGVFGIRIIVCYCDRLPTGCRLDVDWMSYYCMLAADSLALDWIHSLRLAALGFWIILCFLYFLYDVLHFNCFNCLVLTVYHCFNWTTSLWLVDSSWIDFDLDFDFAVDLR